MTENEAYTNACCGPRNNGEHPEIRCIASACMAWRGDGRTMDMDGNRTGEKQGHCGLAGEA